MHVLRRNSFYQSVQRQPGVCRSERNPAFLHPDFQFLTFAQAGFFHNPFWDSYCVAIAPPDQLCSAARHIPHLMLSIYTCRYMMQAILPISRWLLKRSPVTTPSLSHPPAL